MLRLDRIGEALAAGKPMMSGGIALHAGQAGLGAVRLAGRSEGGGVTTHMPSLLHPDGLHRCPWPGQDPFYVAYHDDEWGVPERDDRALYEKLMLDGFQAGLSWITILRKRENFRRAFDGFEPREDRALHAEENRAADAGRRHRAQPHEDRGRGRLGARLARRDGKRSGLFRAAVGISSTASRR